MVTHTWVFSSVGSLLGWEQNNFPSIHTIDTAAFKSRATKNYAKLLLPLHRLLLLANQKQIFDEIIYCIISKGVPSYMDEYTSSVTHRWRLFQCVALPAWVFLQKIWILVKAKNPKGCAQWVAIKSLLVTNANQCKCVFLAYLVQNYIVTIT